MPELDPPEGGSVFLKLENLHLSGKSAPDSAGNALVRTSRYSMLQAYQLLVDGCEVSDLDVNHSFNFLAVSKSTLADRLLEGTSTLSQREMRAQVRWAAQIAAAARYSMAKSRSDTLSSEFAVGRSNPSAAAVASRSIGKAVPASAAAPSATNGKNGIR